MDISISINVIFLVIALAINTLLAIFVLRNNPRSATNIIFAFLNGLTSLWLVTIYISSNPSYLSTSLYWIRLSLFLAVPQSVFFFLLAYAIPRERLFLHRKLLYLIFAATVFLMILTLSPYVFTSIETVNGLAQPLPGFGMLLFAPFVIFFSCGAIYTLFRKLGRAADIQRQQLWFVAMGIVLMLGLIIFTILVPVILFKVNTFVPFSPLYTLVFLGMTAYAIVRHQLFNLKVIATEALTITIWIVLFAKIFVSQSLAEKAIDSLILLATISFGILLIRSVKREVEQRERLQALTLQLEEANAQLKKLDAAKSEFISLASHQLRAPLTVIKGYISMMLEGSFGAVPLKLRKPFDIVAGSTNQIIKLVSDMLDLSRIESGKIHYEFKETNFVQMVKKVVKEFEPSAEKKGLKLVLHANTGKIPSFLFDPDKIYEVAVNLIDNAIKYSLKGDIVVRIEETPERTVRLSVNDQGIGIAAQDIGRLFMKFNRLEEAKKIEANGTGIGLYFVKCVVEDHGGKVWVESEGAGQGSTFVVELPMRTQ